MKLLPYCGTVSLNGSKSIIQRYLFISTLAPCRTILKPGSRCEDVLEMVEAARACGVKIVINEDAIQIDSTELSLNNDVVVHFNASATAFRFWLARAIITKCRSTILISGQLFRRPYQVFLKTLKEIGCEVSLKDSDDVRYPHKIEITSPAEIPEQINADSTISSQFISGLMMIATLLKKGLKIKLNHSPVSFSYLLLTREVMQSCFVSCNIDRDTVVISEENKFQPKESYEIEPELAGGAFFLTLGLFSKQGVGIYNKVKFKGHPDWEIIKILQSMGANVIFDEDVVKVQAENIHGINADMENYPDLVPLTSILALFAESSTLLRNISRLQYKESDRISGLLRAFDLIGAEYHYIQGNLEIFPWQETTKSAVLDTQHDHRLAIAFTLLALLYPQFSLSETQSVKKSCPEFFRILEMLKTQPQV